MPRVTERPSITIDLTAMHVDDITLVIHESLVPGEVGDPFPEEFCKLLRGMAATGIWPVDFGESENGWLTLWCKIDSVKNATEQVEQFIAARGDV